jgi:hypothetical protein
MNNISFLKNIDRWLLLNYPCVWATRVHYLLAFLFLGTILSVILAILSPIDPTLEQFSYSSSRSSLRSLWESQLYLGIFSVIILIFCLYQFRAKLRVFTFQEGFLSVFCTAVIAFLFLLFISSYKIIIEKRQARLYSKQDIRRDIVINNHLNILMQPDVKYNSIENLNIDSYLFDKNEAELIRTNLSNFTKLGQLGTGKYLVDETKIIGKKEQDIQYAKNLWFKYYHFKTVEESHIVPDSIKEMYLALSKNIEVLYETPDSIEPALKEYYDREIPNSTAFLEQKMPIISPTYRYLCSKYKRMTNSGLVSDLQQQYAFQNANILENCTSTTNYVSYSDADRILNPDGTYTSFYNFNQKSVDEMYQKFDTAEHAPKFWKSWNLILAILLFPFFVLVFCINFELRDILLSAIAFSLLALFHAILLKNTNIDQYSIYFFFVNILMWAASAYLYFSEESGLRKLAKLFIPLSIFISMTTMPFVVTNWINLYVDANRLDANANPIDYNYLYAYALNLWECYVFLIVPLLVVLYHRLTLSPAKN